MCGSDLRSLVSAIMTKDKGISMKASPYSENLDSLLTPEQEAKTLAILKNPNRELVPEGEVEAIFS